MLLLYYGLRGVLSVFDQIYRHTMTEYTDEAAARRELLRLRVRFELGEIGADEYRAGERALLQRLHDIRALAADSEQEAGSV